METTSSKHQRLISISSYVSPQRPDLPAIFESLNDDTLTTILQFVGNKSYKSFGGINKHCREIYLNTNGMTKETFLFGYAPLSRITERIEGRATEDYRYDPNEALCKGVVLYNRRDVMDWLLKEQNKYVLKRISELAAEEGRIDLLEELWNNVKDDEDNKQYVFERIDQCAACYGKLNMLKWVENKGLSIHKKSCAMRAARNGHLHIIQWLQEEKWLELDGELYEYAVDGSHLHVMKWLREQEVDWLWSGYIFANAAEVGNLDVLQWLHDEGCPWDDDYSVSEESFEPQVIDWLSANGYRDRIDDN